MLGFDNKSLTISILFSLTAKSNAVPKIYIKILLKSLCLMRLEYLI